MCCAGQAALACWLECAPHTACRRVSSSRGSMKCSDPSLWSPHLLGAGVSLLGSSLGSGLLLLLVRRLLLAALLLAAAVGLLGGRLSGGLLLLLIGRLLLLATLLLTAALLLLSSGLWEGGAGGERRKVSAKACWSVGGWDSCLARFWRPRAACGVCRVGRGVAGTGGCMQGVNTADSRAQRSAAPWRRASPPHHRCCSPPRSCSPPRCSPPS